MNPRLIPEAVFLLLIEYRLRKVIRNASIELVENPADSNEFDVVLTIDEEELRKLERYVEL